MLFVNTLFLTLSLLIVVEHQDTQCERERKIASSPYIADIYVPKCDNLGNFMPVQCFEHSTYVKQCWCVDSTGQQIKGTKTRGGTEPVCGNTIYKC
jgi:hypothetical protein